ncbi:hypothetical protein [Mucilaginibacter sp.]
MRKLIMPALIVTIAASCTNINYHTIYPIGAKFNYAAGPLTDLVQSGRVPTDPFTIDSIVPHSYGNWVGYFVTSANGISYTMSNADIKIIK